MKCYVIPASFPIKAFAKQNLIKSTTTINESVFHRRETILYDEDGEKWMRLNCMGRLKNLEVNFKKDGGGRDSDSSKLTSV